jgi:nucleoside-diphosphate-sugar epimerase
VDKIVLEAANSCPGVKTLIVGPPLIYGPGRGPGNQRSIQVYDLAKFALQRGYAPYVDTGKVEWDNVHIHDLSDLFVSFVEAALDPAKNSDPEIFGPKAYFFAENGVLVWGEVAKWVAEEAHRQGFLKEPKTVRTDTEGIKSLDGASNSSWATNSKSVATRARKYFGWKPTRRSLKDEIPDVVSGEAKRLGIKPSYSPSS